MYRNIKFQEYNEASAFWGRLTTADPLIMAYDLLKITLQAEKNFQLPQIFVKVKLQTSKQIAWIAFIEKILFVCNFYSITVVLC